MGEREGGKAESFERENRARRGDVTVCFSRPRKCRPVRMGADVAASSVREMAEADLYRDAVTPPDETRNGISLAALPKSK